MLDRAGIFLALVFAILLFVFGGLEYLTMMLVFFVIAVIVTRYDHRKKRNMGIYEHERGWENVLSNGFLPTVLAVANPYIGFLPFLGSLAAVTADKFASELGVLGGQPISLETFKEVRPGTSGAVTFLGFLMSLAGGIFIGASAIFVFGIDPNTGLLIGIAGFAGSLADSIFGILEERGFGTKGTTNFVCSLVGGVLGYLIGTM